MARGMFITLEGGEGSGKSTQGRLLKDRLEKAGRSVVLTREPGGTPEAEHIRKLLIDRQSHNWAPLSEVMLFFAARADHARNLILPALREGKIVICDRFTDSTRAYQGAAGGVAPETIEAIKQAAIGDLEPDLTLILDVPVELGLSRAGGRMAKTGSSEDRFEAKDAAFHERLRRGYLSIAGQNPQRCRVIDASLSIGAVAETIARAVDA